MKSLRFLLFWLLLISGWMNAFGQDPQFSQFSASPQYLNPALTGNTYQDRIAMNFRLQWPGVQPGYKSYSVAYDHRNAALSSGFGGYVLHDQTGNQGLKFTLLALSYSYEARINRKRALRFGVRGGYTMRGISRDEFLFADQVIRDDASTSVESNIIENISYMDLAGGVVYYSDALWAGVSINHLNTPNQSLLTGGNANLPMRFTFHGGYRIALDDRILSRSETRFTLATSYKAQGKWDQLDVGGYIDHQRLSFGLWYRGLPIAKAYKQGYGNSDAVIMMIGVQTDNKLRFTYSYDITVSKLGLKSGGAHEISLIYEWPKRRKERNYKIVPCPKF
mgnify:FL=1